MKKISIKLKITLWYILVMTLLSGTVFFAMTSVSRKMLENDIRGRLTRSVRDASRRVGRPDDSPGQKPPVVPKQRTASDADQNAENQPPNPMPEKKTNNIFNIYEPDLYSNGIHMAIYNKDGEIVAGIQPYNIENFPEFKENKFDVISESSGKYYIETRLLIANDGEQYWLRGVVSVEDESFALKSAIRINVIMTVILIIVAAFGGYFIIKRILRPVDEIRRTADEISESSDLSQRIALDGGSDEFYRLAASFDGMLDKIEQTLEREKQFTSDASHELRTPVAAILSACEYMTGYAKNYDEMKSSAESLKEEAERMSKLISQLLAVSRMDNNSVKFEFDEVDASELLNFVCDEQEEIRSDTDIIMHRRINKDIFVRADRFMLARLYINLISNAYSYGKSKGNIYISLYKEANKAIFKIKDDGIGIPEEDMEKIWERFYQVDMSRSKNNDGSMGLGLFIVKQIADKHGGTVSVKSEKDCGSEFTFIMDAL